MNTHSSLVSDAKRALGESFSGRCFGREDDDIILVNKQHATALPLNVPELLIRCSDSDDVARALEFVRDRSIPFSIRSGGHCFGDLSNRGDAIIDCAELNVAETSTNNLIISGPGALAGDAVSALAPTGLTLPVGGCPLVALGGLSLVGGFGLTGRHRGLLCDRLAAIEMVLADGQLIRCDANQNSDLLWAMAGAGPIGFGIATRLWFNPAMLQGGIALDAIWPIEHALEICALWQEWAPLSDNAASVQISLMAPDDPNEPAYVRLYGVILDTGQLSHILRGMARHFGPYASQINVVEKSALDITCFAAGVQTYGGEPAWLPSRPYSGTALQAQRSQYFDQAIPLDALKELLQRLLHGRTELQLREIEFIPWRGQYAMQADHSCFPHRNAHMLLRYNSLTGRNPTETVETSMQAWVDDSRDILVNFANGCIYAGYVERDMPNPLLSYFGQNATKLATLKQKYDPDSILVGLVG